MYSKSGRFATFVLVALAAGCSGALPWHDEPVADEVNLVFNLQNNLVFLPSTTIDGAAGKFLLGSAQVTSAVDPRFAHAHPSRRARVLHLNEREQLTFTPSEVDLRGVADAIIGADAWRGRALTIDYRSGLLTYQKSGIHPDGMMLYRFRGAPAVDVGVDGRSLSAIVDTTSPDTLVLPRANAPQAPRRGVAHLTLAGTDLGKVDIEYGSVSQPHIGNRLLSKYLVTIDYGKGLVGLWRDPRIH
jgi:hypothetical protein